MSKVNVIFVQLKECQCRLKSLMVFEPHQQADMLELSVAAGEIS
ncbi:hypothetical protein [Nostoc sp.]